jgi:DNA-binding NarL/FixJ family response regulator
VPKTSVQPQGSPAERSAHGTIALIASGEPANVVAAILETDGFDVRSFASTRALLHDRSTHDPSVIVLWVQDAISAIPALIEPLAKRQPPSPIVVVCAAIQRWEVRGALAAGAAGVVLSSSLQDTLGPSIRAVAAGQICVPRRQWRQVEPPVLSTREKQILGLVVMGYMNSQIAERLFLAESTVKSHLSSAFGKLGVRSRNEAVDLIINPDRGLGMGILGLGGEPLQPVPAATQ